MNDANFALNIKQLMTLEFIPVPDVMNKFDELMTQHFFVIIYIYSLYIIS